MKNYKIKINTNMIIALYVITIFFDAYCFVEIGNRAVTLFYPVSLLPILLTLKKTISHNTRNSPLYSSCFTDYIRCV